MDKKKYYAIKEKEKMPSLKKVVHFVIE